MKAPDAAGILCSELRYADVPIGGIFKIATTTADTLRTFGLRGMTTVYLKGRGAPELHEDTRVVLIRVLRESAKAQRGDSADG